ncbi:MAG TPA: exodeoxyribonuclease VII small subunit [Bacillota bacterium]|nr:exodeoxyribonuclease VII small subunit [Bacillota bacterium]
MRDEKELNFEQAMEQLEKIVERLEAGDVPLEKAIKDYQAGMELTKLCHEKLTSVKEKMTKIVTEQNKLETFDLEEEV